MLAISALYLYKLDGIGVGLEPDEPRYAAVGRNMARTGDLVTPVLWGSHWFEKPPLLYWMTALGTVAGLNPELSARLPVALLSLAFVVISFFLLRREFGPQAAAASVALLATSAGWIVYSQLCLTDLPLAAFFSLAVFLALPLLRDEAQTERLDARLFVIGACLAIAALAKGLVPIALALPFPWFLRCYWRRWWIAALSLAAVALPWYLAVYLRNGYPFIEDFFIKHHLERLYSPALQHVQPWYYYFPVLLAGIFPWTPLLGLLALRANIWDTRRRFLAVVILFGFAFFSASLNKLPGYLIPLLPSLFTLIGAHLENRSVSEISRWWLVPCAFLIAVIPLLSPLLPQSLAAGRLASISVSVHSITRPEWFYIFVPLIVCMLARRSWAGVLLVLCVVSGAIYLKQAADPVLDRELSARGLWRELQSFPGRVCAGWVSRDWIYGLSFYRGALYPPCDTGGPYDYAIEQHGHRRPVIVPLH